MEHTVFFDLDGTLTDPFIGITGSIQFALERLGEDVPDSSELTWCIGPPLQETFTTLVGEEDMPAAITHYRERFGEVGLYENTPYPGIHDVLAKLRERGFRLCVASSKPHIYVNRILERFELDSFFEHVFGSELDGTRTNKVDLLRHALVESDRIASASTMIGDRGHDMRGAVANDIATVGVLYGYGSADELREAGAHRLAKTPQELVDLFG